jgi:hypothetical protein
MSLSEDVDLEEFVMAKDDMSGADIKAVCTEAGLLALRERRMRVTKADFTTAREKVYFAFGVASLTRYTDLGYRFFTGRMRAHRRVSTYSTLLSFFFVDYCSNGRVLFINPILQSYLRDNLNARSLSYSEYYSACSSSHVIMSPS